MAQTNFTAADMYPKASIAKGDHAAPVAASAPKKAKKVAAPEPVVEAPVVEEVIEEAPVDSE